MPEWFGGFGNVIAVNCSGRECLRSSLSCTIGAQNRGEQWERSIEPSGNCAQNAAVWRRSRERINAALNALTRLNSRGGGRGRRKAGRRPAAPHVSEC